MIEENIRFIPLTNKMMFQNLFNNNTDILKEMLISVLGLNINNNLRIKIMDRDYDLSIKKANRTNMLVSIGKFIKIDLEINYRGIGGTKNTNIMYISRIISNKKYHDSANLYYFYQLNLNLKKDNEEPVERNYSLHNNKYLDNNVVIVNKYLDYFYNLYYVKNKNVSKDIVWLALLSAKSFEELEEMASKVMTKEQKNRFINETKELCNEEIIISYSFKERLDKLADYEYEQSVWKKLYIKGIEQGYNDEIEEVYNDGIREGININTLNIIKKMLKENIDIILISRITNKKIDEIKEIARSLD